MKVMGGVSLTHYRPAMPFGNRKNILEDLFNSQGNHPRPNTDFSMKTIWAISTRPRMIFGHFKSGKKVF